MLGSNKFKIPLVAASMLVSSMTFAAPDLSAYDHLKMSTEEVGQMRWAEEWTNLSEDDFFAQIPATTLEDIPFAPKSLTLAEERYILGFRTYALGLQQFHKLNAMPAFLKDTMDVLIQRMQHNKATWYWEENSMFGVYAEEPFFLNNNIFATWPYVYPYPYAKETDPVRVRNTMYKNHLTQMISFYQKLYGDYKYSQPNSITLTDNAGGTYSYDYHELVDLSYWEMKKDNAKRGPNNTNFFKDLAYRDPDVKNACIECEPNMCWAPCNTHVLISLKMHDEQFGTTYFNDIKAKYKQWMDDKGMYIEDHANPDYAWSTSVWHALKQDETLGVAEAGDSLWEKTLYMGTMVAEGYPIGMLAQGYSSTAVEGWTLTFMNSYSEDIWGNQRAQDAWPTLKNRHYIDLGQDSDGDYVAHAQDGLIAHTATPFFTAVAGEAGDYQAQERMTTWSDKEYLGQWGNNGAVTDSPFSGDAFWFPPESREHLVSPMQWLLDIDLPFLDPIAFYTEQGASGLTGTLVHLGRANIDNGVRDIVQESYAGSASNTPKVRSVNWPAVKVHRAIYDPSASLLLVTTGGGSGGNTSFEVYDMDTAKSYTLYIDDVISGTYSNSTTIDVTVPHDGQEHNIVLVEV